MSWLLFNYCEGLLSLGSQKTLATEDLWTLPRYQFRVSRELFLLAFLVTRGTRQPGSGFETAAT